MLAASELARHGPAADERAAKRTIAAVMRSVGEELGNTAAFLLESLHPLRLQKVPVHETANSIAVARTSGTAH